jgi:signal transduction histidine kinase
VKRTTFNFIVLLFLFFFVQFSYSTNSQQTTILKVGVYDNFPKVHQDENGNWIGIFPDLLRNIANKEGWILQFQSCIWSECLEALRNNLLDIMVDVGYSAERAEIYDFNRLPVFTNWGVGYITSNSTISNFEDLAEKKISVLRDSIHTEGETGIKALLEKLEINSTFVEFDSYDDVIRAVNNYEVDMGIVNRIFGIANEEKYPNIKRSFLVFNPVNLHFGFTKGAPNSEYLINAIDIHLQQLINDLDSEYYKIMNEYLFTVQGEGIPNWILPAILGFIALIVFFIILSSLFKHQLNIKTLELQNLINSQDRTIVEATKELREANTKLRELDQLKSIFLASMSHELRTPLNSIIGFTSILLMGMAGELTEEQTKQLKMVDKSSKHLLNLISDVLDISKIESNTLQIMNENFFGNELINNLIESIKPQAENSGLEIETIFPSQDLFISSDKRRVSQILLNFLSNAIKFSNNSKIIVESNFSNLNWTVSIKDQGIGIKKENLSKLFYPFSQLDDSTTKKYEGTGLGLYISKKLAILLGGDVTIESEFGKGTKVSLILPIKKNY